MVRNIDLPEALIVYGRQVLSADTNGLSALIQECHDIGTVVILLLEKPNYKDDPLSDDDEDDGQALLATLRSPTASTRRSCRVHWQTRPAPNPADLLHILETVSVQPRPFGGSAGFGSKAADPERLLSAQYSVVLTSTLDETRAARAVGMRVVALQNNHDDDDDLADAVVEAIEFGVDDIATPGSYWLNPPHARDDGGNRVDPYQLLDLDSEDANSNQIGLEQRAVVETTLDSPDLDDDDIQAILADLAPLPR
jgi:hypothetical protein